MAISKIKVGTTEHELQTTIANVTNLQASLDAKANSADIAKTVYTAASNSSPIYVKISDFGAWGTGAWYQKGFSMLLTSRAGELVWVSVAADDSNTNAKALRLLNTYTKINNVYYSASESAIYCRMVAWCNNLSAHILTNVNGDYVPTVAQASALPSDAVEISIVEFGVSSSGTQVGDTSVNLLLGGAATRPTYNGNDVALQSDVDSACTTLKNDLLNGAGAAYDTLKELGDLIDENTTAIDALETVAAGKANASHSHSAATTSAAGFMSASDKSKLDGIASGANAYSLPTATSSTLGGVKVGSNISVSSGTISLSKANVTSALGYTPPTSDTNTWRGIQNNLTSTSTTDSLSAYQGKVLNDKLADKASISTANTYNGEQKFQNSQYCPTAQDNASGVGAAYKASRGAVNQEIVGQIIMPYTTVSDSYGCDNTANTIKFQKITATNSGVPSLSTVATLTDSYLNVPALKVGGSTTLPNSISGNANTSTRPTGFSGQQSTWGWGVTTAANGYTQLTDWTHNGGEIAFSEKDGQVFCQLDGFFYQREGGSRCLDTSDTETWTFELEDGSTVTKKVCIG